VTITCEGVCEKPKPPEAGGRGETLGSFMLNAVVDGPLTADCPEGRVSKFALN
jgi:hypothetical protein